MPLPRWKDKTINLLWSVTTKFVSDATNLLVKAPYQFSFYTADSITLVSLACEFHSVYEPIFQFNSSLSFSPLFLFSPIFLSICNDSEISLSSYFLSSLFISIRFYCLLRRIDLSRTILVAVCPGEFWIQNHKESNGKTLTFFRRS